MKRTTRRCNCALFRAGVRSVYFVIILLLYSLWQHYSSSQNNNNHRQLIEEEDDDDLCPDINKADPAWLSIFYLLGVFYTFIAIAIVCDELFVPTLEEIASDRHLNLSMDVAGATLMAAGGSAPELFTSIFGTFVQHSEVGIGTVVGSAVFNVLFVIAMCALWSKEVLELTWWPLFRDSTYYSIGLIVLGLFVGVISPSEIELWEAIVLFLMYIGYVFVMCFNRRLYKLITGRELPATGEGTDKNLHGGLGDEEKQEGKEETEEAQDEEAPQQPQRPHPVKVMSNRSLISALTITTPQGGVQWPGTFRSGILNILRSSKSLTEAAGIGIVAIIAGDVHHVFRKVDVDDNGEIDREELAQLFAKLGHTVANDELDDLMQELDHNKDGKITEEDFTVWYIQSEQQISSRVRVIFDYFDTDNSGTINHSKIKSLLENVEPAVTDQDVEEAMLAMYQNGSRDEISFEEFSNWYIHSMIYNRQTQRAKAELQGILENLKPPSPGSVMTYIKCITIFPIVLVLGYTVPDVRRPGCHKFCYISFVLSIAWIGFFSYFMVDWAEIIGHTIGIPSVIMGLTLLAAGTSVPDLLTSVIVARMGEGDMALSSSIGSNIFDILVGLPLPWVCYTAWNKTVITIGSDNVWLYIFTLLGMLIFVVIATHCQGWRLTRTLAIFMLLFYFGFLAMAISLEVPFEVCNK